MENDQASTAMEDEDLMISPKVSLWLQESSDFFTLEEKRQIAACFITEFLVLLANELAETEDAMQVQEIMEGFMRLTVANENLQEVSFDLSEEGDD